MGRAMTMQVEELPDNRVRLKVEVPRADLQHAVQHAKSDLAGSVKVPGFRKGKVPTQGLEARIGRERSFSEAAESHIGGQELDAQLTLHALAEAPLTHAGCPDHPRRPIALAAAGHP